MQRLNLPFTLLISQNLLLLFLQLINISLALCAVSSLSIQRHKLVDNFSLAMSCSEVAHLVCVLATYKFLLFQIVLIHCWVNWYEFCYLVSWPFEFHILLRLLIPCLILSHIEVSLSQFFSNCLSLHSIICGSSEALLPKLILHYTFVLGLLIAVRELLSLLPFYPFFLFFPLLRQSINWVNHFTVDCWIVVVIIICSCVSLGSVVTQVEIHFLSIHFFIVICLRDTISRWFCFKGSINQGGVFDSRPAGTLIEVPAVEHL